MFGMLDYRAHKLYWLIMLPFTIIAKLGFFAVVFGAVAIAHEMTSIVLLNIVLAYIIMEAISLIIYLPLWLLISGAIKKFFFWLVDVVPSYGTNAEEAEAVVLQGGKLFKLNKKFESEIENWTFDDTDAYMPLAFNWRARLFFKVKDRLDRVVVKLQEIQQETGEQPGVLGRRRIEEIRESVEDGHITWIEQAITGQIFHSILGFAIISITIICLQEKPDEVIGEIILLAILGFILVKVGIKLKKYVLLLGECHKNGDYSAIAKPLLKVASDGSHLFITAFVYLIFFVSLTIFIITVTAWSNGGMLPYAVASALGMSITGYFLIKRRFLEYKS